MGQAIARLGSAWLVLNKPFGSARLDSRIQNMKKLGSARETVAREAQAARRANISQKLE